MGAELVSWSGGTCVPTHRNGGKACWVKDGSSMRPAWERCNRWGSCWVEYGFGDGAFFDRTPQVLDNNYYKLFAHENFDGKDNCCGEVKHGGCHRQGRMARITSRSQTGAAVTSTSLPGRLVSEQACSVGWCRSDRKGRSHMKSTQAWHEPAHHTVKKSSHHGMVKRMVRLAADWALLANEETKKFVQLFAVEEHAFHSAFAEAWQKVISKTHVALSECTGPEPTNSEVDQWIKAAKCEDSHGRCTKMWGRQKRNRCRNPVWINRCPVTCNRCPSMPIMR